MRLKLFAVAVLAFLAPIGAAKAAAQGGIIGYGQRRAVVELTSGK